jgi:hypothetical protein
VYTTQAQVRLFDHIDINFITVIVEEASNFHGWDVIDMPPALSLFTFMENRINFKVAVRLRFSGKTAETTIPGIGRTNYPDLISTCAL